MSAEIQPLSEEPPELSTIDISMEDEVAIVSLNRPDAFNAMSPELLSEMSTAVAWLADRSGARAAVLTGAGGAFSAGGDVNWFKRGFDSGEIDLVAELRRGAGQLHHAIVDLRRIHFPVIAAINGPAAAAGLSLALACDIRIASEKAMLACAYGRIGVSPDGGMTWLLPRVVGAGRAMELLLNDPNLDAEAALREGLVTEVAAPDELMARAREKAKSLGSRSPHYVRHCKALVNSSFERPIEQHLQLERDAIADSMHTEDVRTGVSAFLAGEKPEFTGR